MRLPRTFLISSAIPAGGIKSTLQCVQIFRAIRCPIVAFIVDANKNKKTIIDIEYENGARKTLSTIGTYSFLYIKQPGTLPYKLTTTVDYPEDYTPVDTTADSYGKNFLEVTDSIKKDFATKIDLQKKK
jgi:hypothetical protein